jgi:hypothetical protein
MLMNVDETGRQIGRPMRPSLIQHDPHIYFLTHQSSQIEPHVGEARELMSDPRVYALSQSMSSFSTLLRTLAKTRLFLWRSVPPLLTASLSRLLVTLA